MRNRRRRRLRSYGEGFGVNAIFGCLLGLVGGLLGIQELLTGEYPMLWLPVLFVSVGLFMLLRNQSDDVVDEVTEDGCTTCRGAGTVYSDEWNDWRKSGPVHTIRELCPTCQGEA
jgi:uncharacterized membrane protein YfcA